MNTEFLKYFIPSPIRKLFRRIEKAAVETRKEIYKLDLLLKECKELKREHAMLERQLPEKNIFWNNSFEKDMVISNWGDVSKDENFADKYLKLISGLDVKSIETVARILLRQRQYLNTNAKEINFFTREEQNELRLLQENFYSQIIQLAPNIYAWRNYLLPIRHFESSVFYTKHCIDELEFPNKIKDKAIIDVGGFIGDSVLVLNELEPSKIYTFEAVPENFANLQKTLELNHISNCVAENFALGESKGTIQIQVLGSCSSSVTTGVNFSNSIDVPVITLDEYIAKNPMEIGLIKIDIEGGEPYFLKGAKKTICEQKPTLLVSIYHNAHDFFEIKPMIESWNLGYKFKIRKPVFHSATGETLLICEIC